MTVCVGLNLFAYHAYLLSCNHRIISIVITTQKVGRIIYVKNLNQKTNILAVFMFSHHKVKY